jgi:hypothetical protein
MVLGTKKMDIIVPLDKPIGKKIGRFLSIDTDSLHPGITYTHAGIADLVGNQGITKNRYSITLRKTKTGGIYFM